LHVGANFNGFGQKKVGEYAMGALFLEVHGSFSTEAVCWFGSRGGCHQRLESECINTAAARIITSDDELSGQEIVTEPDLVLR
jgi:hypothetical protein